MSDPYSGGLGLVDVSGEGPVQPPEGYYEVPPEEVQEGDIAIDEEYEPEAAPPESAPLNPSYVEQPLEQPIDAAEYGPVTPVEVYPPGQDQQLPPTNVAPIEDAPLADEPVRPEPAQADAPSPEGQRPLGGILPEFTDAVPNVLGELANRVTPEGVREKAQGAEQLAGELTGASAPPPTGKENERRPDQPTINKNDLPTPTDIAGEGVAAVKADPVGMFTGLGSDILSLGGEAVDAVKDDGIDAVTRGAGDLAQKFGNAVDYWGDVNKNRMVGRLLNPENQAPTPPIIGGIQDWYDTNLATGRVANDIRSDPEVQAKAEERLRNGFVMPDGSFIAPGERAVWEGYQHDEPEFSQRLLNETLSGDPTFAGEGLLAILSGGASVGATRAPRLLGGVSKALHGAERVFDVATTAGASEAVPALWKGAERAGGSLFKPTERAVTDDTVDAAMGGVDELISNGRIVTPQELGPEYVARLPKGAAIIRGGARDAPEALAIQTKAVKGKDQLVGVLDDVNDPASVRAFGPQDYDKTLRLMSTLPQDEYLTANRMFLPEMMQPDPVTHIPYLETKKPVTPGANPDRDAAYERWATMMSDRVKRFDAPGSVNAIDDPTTNRQVATGLLASFERANKYRRTAVGGGTEAERILASFEDVTKRAGQFDQWAANELNLARTRIKPATAIPNAAANNKLVTGARGSLTDMAPSDFFAANGGQKVINQLRKRVNGGPPVLALTPGSPQYAALRGVYLDRLTDPAIRKADADFIARKLPTLTGPRANHEQALLFDALESAGLIGPTGGRTLPDIITELNANIARVPAHVKPITAGTTPYNVFDSRLPAATPNQILAPDPDPVAGLYSPGSFESKIKSPISKDAKDALEANVTLNGVNRRVGDIALDHAKSVEQMRLLARFDGTQAPINIAEGKKLTDVKNRLKEMGMEPDWKNMTDRQATNAAKLLTKQDLETGYGLRSATGKEIPKQSNAVVEKLDTYLNMYRSAQLYSTLKGPTYPAMQAVGNLITLALAQPTALAKYMFSDWKGTWKYLKNPVMNELPDTLKWADEWGVKPGKMLTDTLQGMYGGNWFSSPDRNPITRAAGKIIANENISLAGNVFDVAMRQASYKDVMERGFTAGKHEISRVARKELGRRQAAGAAIPLTDKQVDQTLKTLAKEKAGRPFTPLEVREALFKTGGGDMAPNRQQLYNFADRVSRDWQTIGNKTNEAALGAVERVGFSFKATPVDEVLSRTFMYHYWMSRASRLYTQTAAGNPTQMRAWMGAMEAIQEHDDTDDMPAWRKTFSDFTQTPAGWTVALDPLTLAGTYFFFADTEIDGSALMERSGWGAFVDDGLLSNVMLNPLFNNLSYLIGAKGKDGAPVDIFGTGKFEKMISDAANAINVLAGGYLYNQNGAATLIPKMDNRKLTNYVATIISGEIPGTSKVPPLNVDYANQDNMRVFMLQDLSTNHPDLTEDQRGEAIDLAFNHPNEPLYQNALANTVMGPYQGPGSDKDGIWWDALGAAARLWSPLGMIAYPTAKEDITRRKETDTQTAMDKRLANSRYSGSAEERTLSNQLNTYKEDAMGLEYLIKQANPELPQSEVDKMVAQERLNPTDLSRQEAENRGFAQIHGQIVSGKIEKPVVVDGKAYDAAALLEVPYEDRYKLADAWADENDAWGQVNQYRSAQRAYVEAHPEVKDFMGWKEAYKSYDDTGTFIEAQRDINPGFNQFMTEVERTKPRGSQEWKNIGMSAGGYMASMGIRQGSFDVNPTGNGEVVGVPKGGLSKLYDDAQEEYGNYGTGDKSSLLKDMESMRNAIAIADQWGEGGLVKQRVIDQTTRVSSSAYSAIGAAGAYIPDGEHSDISKLIQFGDEQAALGVTFKDDDALVTAYLESAASSSERPEGSGGTSGPRAEPASLVSLLGYAAPVMSPQEQAQTATQQVMGKEAFTPNPVDMFAQPGGVGWMAQTWPAMPMRVVGQMDGWLQVMAPNGQRGWIKDDPEQVKRQTVAA